MELLSLTRCQVWMMNDNDDDFTLRVYTLIISQKK